MDTDRVVNRRAAACRKGSLELSVKRTSILDAYSHLGGSVVK